MRGNDCPVCAAPVMPLRRFMKEVDTNVQVRCDSCGATLARSTRKATFLLVGTGMVAGVIGYTVIGHVLVDPTIPNLLRAGVFLLLVMPAFVVGVKAVGWAFLRWVPVPEPERLVGE